MPIYSTPQARINYKKKNDKEGYLLLKIQYQRKQINFNLSHYLTTNDLPSTIERKYWDVKEGQTIHFKKFDNIYFLDKGKRKKEKDIVKGQNNVEINNCLEKIKEFVYTQLKGENEISHEELKLELAYFTGKKARPTDPNKKQIPSLFEFIEELMAKKRRNGKEETRKKYLTTLNHIKNFSSETGFHVDYYTIDWEFRNKFTEWLYAPPREHSANNAAKLLSILKVFMQEALKLRYHQNSIYKESGFNIKGVKTKNKARLNFEELKLLADLDLSETPPLDRVRDLFLVGCYTGLRYSDWHSVNKQNIIVEDDLELLNILTKKTSMSVFIPLLPELKAILEKYDYQIPKYTGQYFNRTIKKICKQANIDNLEMRIFSKAGETREERLEKYKMVTSHCARRSFASNFYDMGIPAFILMQITGHTTEKQFFEYIDLSKKDLAKKFALQVKMFRKENYLKKAN